VIIWQLFLLLVLLGNLFWCYSIVHVGHCASLIHDFQFTTAFCLKIAKLDETAPAWLTNYVVLWRPNTYASRSSGDLVGLVEFFLALQGSKTTDW